MHTFKRKDRGDITARYDKLALAKRMCHVPLQKMAKLVVCVWDDDRQVKIMSESEKIGGGKSDKGKCTYTMRIIQCLCHDFHRKDKSRERKQFKKPNTY